MRVTTPQELGDAVRAMRRSLGMTQQDLADRANLSRQSLNGLERGAGNPTWDLVARLFAALEVELTAVQHSAAPGPAAPSPVDLDALLAAHTSHGVRNVTR